MHKKSQAILDFVLAFIVIGVLTVGMVRLWVWLNANYAFIQSKYQDSRIKAGTGESPGCIDCPDVGNTLKPLTLNKDFLFKGRANESFSSPEGTVGAPPDPPEVACCNSFPNCRVGDECDFYCVEFARCVCEGEIAPIVVNYDSLIQQLRTQADELDHQAHHLRDAARRCDEPWEICSWNKTGDQLKKAARKMEGMADDLRDKVALIEDTKNKLIACCQSPNDNLFAQRQCITDVLRGQCAALTEGQYALWQAELDEMEAEMNEIRSNIITLENIVSQCNSNAATYCRDYCINYCGAGPPSSCYTNCYNPCYENERNSCCRASSSNRNCDTANPPCDHPYPRCGLTEIIRRYNQCELAVYYTPLKTILQQLMSQVFLCCSDEELGPGETGGEYRECISALTGAYDTGLTDADAAHDACLNNP